MEHGTKYELVTPRGTVTFNGFENDPLYGYSGDYYRLTGAEGLDFPSLRTPLDERPQADGAIAYDFWRGARFPSLLGLIVARGADAVARRREMEDELREHLNAILRADGTLRWYPSASEQYAANRLTLDSDQPSDAMRTANVQGDGRAVEGSVGAWPRRTNLITNGGLETNTTGWNVFQCTVARITSRSKFGAACGRCTVVATPGTYDTTHNTAISGATAGRVYTASIWVYAEGAVVGKNGFLKLAEEGGSAGYLESVNNFVFQAGWQRVTLTRTIVGNNQTNLRLIIGRTGSVLAAEYFDFDGAQMELCESIAPIATPYIHTDGATATRNGSISPEDEANLGVTLAQGWLAFRARTQVGGTGPTDARLFSWTDLSDVQNLRLRRNAGNIEFTRRGAGSPQVAASKAVTWNAGDVHTFVIAWTAGELKISVDGSAFTSVPHVDVPTTPTDPYFGNAQFAVGNFGWGGEILWVASGAGTLTDADAAWIGAQTQDGATKVDERLGRLHWSHASLAQAADPRFYWEARDDHYQVPGARQCTVRAYEPYQGGGDFVKEFRLGLVAPDPLVYSSEQAIIDDLTSPFAVTVDNEGNADVGPLIYVWVGGSSAGFDLRNDTSLKLVRLAGLPTNCVVAIDMAREAVYRTDTGANLIDKLTVAASDFWTLAPGTTTISLQSVTGTVTQLRAFVRSGWAA
jgi:hypothetical protein